MIGEDDVELVLLVEDNLGDADLVGEYLEIALDLETSKIVHVTTLAEGVKKLGAISPNIVLLDLRLPDGVGVETVENIREAADDVPIVILTGLEDEELALSCISAGAQDYLCKSELHPNALRRAIWFALARSKESDTRHIRHLDDAISTATQSPNEGNDKNTALGPIPLRDRRPNDFDKFADRYAELLANCVQQFASDRSKAIPKMRELVMSMTVVDAGLRDLIEIHTQAVRLVSSYDDVPTSGSLALEGRYMALEMMALLSEQYRSAALAAR